MCLADKRLGMATTFRSWVTVDSQAIPADARRIAVLLAGANDSFGALVFTPGVINNAANISAVTLLQLSNDNASRVLTIEQAGQVLQGALTITSTGSNVFLTEVLSQFPLTPYNGEE